MPRLTSQPWFGPRRVFGWGWSPISWQAWVVIALFVVGVTCVIVLVHSVVLMLLLEAGLILALIVVCLLTSGPPTATWKKKGNP